MKGYLPEADRLVTESTGYRIKYYRIRSGMTQRELAEKCSLNESTIRNYELNNRMPDEKILREIAAALSVSYYALIKQDSDDPEGAVHFLFDLEKLYGFHPEIINDRICMVAEQETDKEKPSAQFYQHLLNWQEAYSNYQADKNKEAYRSWQANYQKS